MKIKHHCDRLRIWMIMQLHNSRYKIYKINNADTLILGLGQGQLSRFFFGYVAESLNLR